MARERYGSPVVNYRNDVIQALESLENVGGADDADAEATN